jgi:hypothetical protein
MINESGLPPPFKSAVALSPGISALLLGQWPRIRDGQYELALCLSSFQELVGLCSLCQRQHATDLQFYQPARIPAMTSFARCFSSSGVRR